MTLPTNDDFANCELSIEELEAIAAGWPSWLHKAVDVFADVFKVAFVAGTVYTLVGLGGIVFGGQRNSVN